MPFIAPWNFINSSVLAGWCGHHPLQYEISKFLLRRAGVYSCRKSPFLRFLVTRSLGMTFIFYVALMCHGEPTLSAWQSRFRGESRALTLLWWNLKVWVVGCDAYIAPLSLINLSGFSGWCVHHPLQYEISKFLLHIAGVYSCRKFVLLYGESRALTLLWLNFKVWL